MLKSIRIWFKKYGTAKYISHLDLNRLTIRVLQRTELPVWRTEGFNPHPFVTFALPLSLGFSGMNESMDIKLLEDVPFNYIIKRMNECMPEGIEIFDVSEPVMKCSEISFADYEIKLSSDELLPNEIHNMLSEFLDKESIITEKKTKSGIKNIDLKPYVKNYSLRAENDCVVFKITLPSGSQTNINPSLLISAMQEQYKTEVFADVKRIKLMNSSMEDFK